MSNFIKHYNDPEKYYDLARCRKIDLSSPLAIILVMDDDVATPTLETEVFPDQAACKKRLENLLLWSDTNGDQNPA